MDRRGFLLTAAAAPLALRQPRAATVYVTADLESHVAVVDLDTGAVRRRIETGPGPRSVERVGEVAVAAHTVTGELSILDGSGVRDVVHGFAEPRYTAAAPDGRHAFVTDSGRADLATVDVLRGTVVARLKLRNWPRHLSLSRDGRTLWVALGTAAPVIAIVDVRDPQRPRLEGWIRPGFAVHDVGFAPDGRVWVTGGEAATIAVHEQRTFRILPAGAAPQHVTFLAGRAFVTSGDDGTLQVWDAGARNVLRSTRVPVGSYNVQFAAGRVITPSLNAGTLCVLDSHGRLRERARIARSSHDACLAGG